jgi:hypothetical protein
MKPGEKILALFFFIVIGLAGLALIGLGSWLLLSPIQSTGQSDAPIFLTPTLAPSEDQPIIITATLEPSQTPAPTVIPAATSVSAATALPTPTITQAAPLTWQACPGAPPSELHVGNRAMVSLNPPLPNNVRAQPDITSKFLFAIQPGEVVEIIDGPGCSNNWVWWQVKTQDGRTGWTAEGDETDYWLVPAK